MSGLLYILVIGATAIFRVKSIITRVQVKQENFVGFRYEFASWKSSSDWAVIGNAIKNKADEMYCFGWAQPNIIEENKVRIAGEARCGKRAGRVFLRWMKENSNAGSFLVYEDTKIKLLFPEFVLLEPGRPTCFDGPPHQCTENGQLESQYVDEEIIWSRL
eukprot:CAMPEP_0203744110 /NCGR_PEP_ID=MMETSP0098-20131031/303_1 /ASSEMBLY_ACC=CAM_ASM_000208 /TAXON_ID=96639 /ORGANISM=" , Strain NY0313808BC1" /LENGTH=160 /DNA_ID=CAMNT_0050631551 /DNA_START=246 /DNA_END=728 /DNA_ORIENTATION=+